MREKKNTLKVILTYSTKCEITLKNLYITFRKLFLTCSDMIKRFLNLCFVTFLFKPLTISLIYDLSHPNDFAFIIAYRQREYMIRLIASLEINFTIESWIVVCILNVHHLLRFCYMTCDANTKWNNNFFLRTLNCIIESFLYRKKDEKMMRRFSIDSIKIIS